MWAVIYDPPIPINNRLTSVIAPFGSERQAIAWVTANTPTELFTIVPFFELMPDMKVTNLGPSQPLSRINNHESL